MSKSHFYECLAITEWTMFKCYVFFKFTDAFVGFSKITNANVLYALQVTLSRLLCIQTKANLQLQLALLMWPAIPHETFDILLKSTQYTFANLRKYLNINQTVNFCWSTTTTSRHLIFQNQCDFRFE